MSATHYRFDLDKTYLATPLEDRLKLLRVPFEPPEAKVTLPGMVALVRALKEHSGPAAHDPTLTILSASPTFLADRLRAKLELDGVAVDDFVFKDQWRLLKRGRLREIASPFAYKLHALCRLGREIPASDVEVLVGDDWDQDPLIYTVYAEQRAGRLPAAVFDELLARNPIGPEAEAEIRALMHDVRGRPSVGDIFIRRERRRGPLFYAAFGHRIATYDDAFQLALLLYDRHRLGSRGIRAVVQELKERRWRDTAFSFSWRSLAHEHFLQRFDELAHLLARLGVMPKRSLWQRLFARAPDPPEPRPLDWTAILDYRPESLQSDR